MKGHKGITVVQSHYGDEETFFGKIIVDANGIQVKRNFSTGVLFCTHKAQHEVAKIANFEKLGWFILWDTLNWLY